MLDGRSDVGEDAINNYGLVVKKRKGRNTEGIGSATWKMHEGLQIGIFLCSIPSSPSHDCNLSRKKHLP